MFLKNSATLFAYSTKKNEELNVGKKALKNNVIGMAAVLGVMNIGVAHTPPINTLVATLNIKFL